MTWKIELRVKAHEGFLGTQWFLIRKRFIKVDSDRISARGSQAAALHTHQEPSKVSDFSKPKGSLSEGVSDLTSAVDDFNRVHSEELRWSNSPPLTEDELVASLWWQYGQSNLTEELKEVVREVALTRTLPKGWSLGLRLTKWGNDEFWETPEQTKSIEIELQRGDGKLIRIRSQYVASRLITSWNYRSESPLRSAIDKFNSQYTTTEPAITCDEVVAAISTLMEKSPSEQAKSHGLTEESIHALRRIAMMHEMGEYKFERVQSFDLADGGKFSVWTVRLTSPKRGHDGKTQSFEIRTRFLKVASDPISLLTGSSQLSILRGSADERPPAEMALLEARIRDAKAENAESLPALLKDRENLLQRAFLAAKAKYEAGQIGIDPFSAWVAELVDAKFATRIAADGHAELHASVPQDDASIMLIEDLFVMQKNFGPNHPSLLPLRDKVLKLRFDHAFAEAGIQKRLFELNRERQQLLKDRSAGHPSLMENSLRHEALTGIRSGSFPKMLKMFIETDPRRTNLLPKELQGQWIVESATTGDGHPLDIPSPSTLSIFNSTIDWHWGEQAREAYVVNGVNVNGKQSLVDLHWRAVAPNMQGGAATGDVQWLVEYRDNKLWIVRLDQPESPVPDSVDNIRPGHTRFILKRAEPYSLSGDTIQLRKEVERLKTTVRGFQSQEKQVTHVRQLPFPKEMQGVWRIKEAFKGVVEKNGRIALAQYENQIITISDSTMFLQSNVVGNYWYLSRLDSSSSTMQVDLSVRSGSDSVYKTFACLLEIQDNKLYLVRAESPGFPRPQSVQELRRGETCFVMTRIGDSPMTPGEVIQVAKETLFEKEDRTVRFKVESVHAPFVLGEPSDGHREGELHLDCRPDPHDFSLDQFLVVLTAECQKKLHSEGVEDITKHFLGKTITAKGPVRGVEYTARAMRGEHFHLIVDDPTKLIVEKSE